MKALKAGLTVYYTSLARLIEDLKRALEQNRLERRWRVYLRPAILVIDEVGYMQLNRQEAELFFRRVSECHEQGSIILTSNKYFSDWGELLSDTVIATALLDRLLHHDHMINIRGQTYRLKDRLKTGVQTVPPAFWGQKSSGVDIVACGQIFASFATRMTSFSLSFLPLVASFCSSSGLRSEWSSITVLFLLVMIRISSIPATTASSTIYWMAGLPTSESISLWVWLWKPAARGLGETVDCLIRTKLL